MLPLGNMLLQLLHSSTRHAAHDIVGTGVSRHRKLTFDAVQSVDSLRVCKLLAKGVGCEPFAPARDAPRNQQPSGRDERRQLRHVAPIAQDAWGNKAAPGF